MTRCTDGTGMREEKTMRNETDIRIRGAERVNVPARIVTDETKECAPLTGAPDHHVMPQSRGARWPGHSVGGHARVRRTRATLQAPLCN
jgi:hypothetical protein